MNKFFVFLIFSLTSYILSSYGEKYFTPRRCKAEISFVRGSDRLNIVAFQSMSSGEGTLSLSGVLYNEEKTTGYISKTIKFSYDKKGNTYLVRSEMISDSPHMTLGKDVEKKWLPPFFYTKGGPLIWTIIPVNNKGSLVFSETVPLFICEKTG